MTRIFKLRKDRCKIGDIVRLRIWDHRKQDDNVREYYVYGRVHRVGPRSITLDSWAIIDPDSADRNPGETTETFTLLKKVTTDVMILVPEHPELHDG